MSRFHIQRNRHDDYVLWGQILYLPKSQHDSTIFVKISVFATKPAFIFQNIDKNFQGSIDDHIKIPYTKFQVSVSFGLVYRLFQRIYREVKADVNKLPVAIFPGTRYRCYGNAAYSSLFNRRNHPRRITHFLENFNKKFTFYRNWTFSQRFYQ